MQVIRDTFVAAQEETASQNHSKGFSDIDDYLKQCCIYIQTLTAVSFFLHNLTLNRAKVCRY